MSLDKEETSLLLSFDDDESIFDDKNKEEALKNEETNEKENDNDYNRDNKMEEKKNGIEKTNKDDENVVKVIFKEKIISIPMNGIANRMTSVDKNRRQNPEICIHFVIGKCKYEDNCFKVHLKENTNSNIIEKIRKYISKHNNNNKNNNNDNNQSSFSSPSHTQFVLTKKKEEYQNNNNNKRMYQEKHNFTHFAKRKRNDINSNNNNDSDDDDTCNYDNKKRRYGFMKNNFKTKEINNTTNPFFRNNNEFVDGTIGNKKIKVDIDGSGDAVVELPLQAMEPTKSSRILSKCPDSVTIGKVCSYFGDGHCKHGNDCSFLHIKPWFLQFVKDNIGNN